MNFEGPYLSRCRDIPLQSFGNHIRPQPHGLGLMSDTITLSHGFVISSFWFSLIYIYIIVDIIPHCKFFLVK